MEFIEDLFVDEKIKDIDTVIYSLKKGIPVYNIYVIYVENDTKDLAVIMSSFEFLKKEKKDYKIIGIARGKFGASQLFSNITQYWLSKGNTVSDFKEGIMRE